MFIDDCPHTFADLAATVLPGHMRRLRVAMQNPHPASLFSTAGKGPTTIAKQLGLSSDFSGCYVLLEGALPIYVGISRSVLARLRQHFLGRTHYDASLAYAIAKHCAPTRSKRSEAMAQTQFRKAFDDAQAYLRELGVAFVQIDNPLELYVF
ncbi:excinuclease ABC subunit C [Betaproteobacteria bacterium PRO7]|jgi:hypothetical protein|nr:excinuclease ABC subunit C [Betaproteobacteria bacterium PRO7]